MATTNRKIELIVIAAEIYVPFAAKFFPPGMEPEWASKIKPFFMDLTDAYLSPIETEEIDTKERVLTSFNSVSWNSLFWQVS